MKNLRDTIQTKPVKFDDTETIYKTQNITTSTGYTLIAWLPNYQTVTFEKPIFIGLVLLINSKLHLFETS